MSSLSMKNLQGIKEHLDKLDILVKNPEVHLSAWWIAVEVQLEQIERLRSDMEAEWLQEREGDETRAVQAILPTGGALWRCGHESRHCCGSCCKCIACCSCKVVYDS